MKVIAGLMIAGVLAGVAAPAYAGSAAPAPSATPLGDTISLEYSPEFFALAAAASGSTPAHDAGQYADSYFKIGFSHSLGNGWGLGVSIQDTVKDSSTLKPNAISTVFQPEGTLGYKWKADALTFGVTGALGVANTHGDAYGGYYAVSGTVDWKLDSKWTWNVINARYRNAFDVTWITPKVATGITYAIDPRQAVYVAVGYAWKDKGDGKGLLADKENVAFGYKLGF